MQGTLLGPYRLDAQIGAGGMGAVWRATVEGAVRGVPVGGTVAVKIVHPHLVADADVFERFVREAGLGRAIRHENVVRTLDAGMEVTDGGELVYLAMEHVVGRTLARLREETGAAPEGFCRRIAREVARGLQGIHGHGVVHGDLKPENVLITRDEVVKVMDLGLARLRDHALRERDRGRFSGSLLYAAPEQFAPGQLALDGPGSALDGRIDLFALGVTLYEMAAGRLPWESADGGFIPRQVEMDAPALRSLRPEISEFFEAVVHALLARDPERRIRSAAELSNLLAEAEDGPWARARRAIAGTDGRAPRTERAARLHGRESEFADLWRCLREAQAGRGCAVVVGGDPGAGRTRLVEELLDAAAGAGVAAEIARAAFSGGRAGADVVATLAARLGATLPPRTVALCIAEDVDLADDTGWEAVVALARRTGGRDALLVLTCCGPLQRARAETLGEATRITLQPLGQEALAALATDVLLAGRPSPALVLRLAETSGGNPGVALAWLQQLVARRAQRPSPDGMIAPAPSAGGDEDAVPPRVVAYGERSLGSVAATDRELLEAAACAGRGFDPALVAAAAGVSERDVESRCGILERRGILRRARGSRWEFVAAATHAAACAGIAEALRCEYRRMYADALLAKEPRDGRDSVDLVRHLLADADAPLPPADVARALAHLDATHRPDAVVSICDAALPRVEDPVVFGIARLRRARALLALGCPGEASAALDEAIGDAPGAAGRAGERPPCA